MEEQDYIVLDVESTGPRDEDFRFATADADVPVGDLLHLERMTPSDAAIEQRRPGRLCAEPIPTRLIAPVAMEGDPPATDGISWGIDAVKATTSPFTGQGVTVAVLDTGIDAAHPAFAGIDVTVEDFTGEGDGDPDGHGTHCAGTIVGRDVDGIRIGVARGVDRLLVGKVLRADGGGTTDSIARGLSWALEAGANVISMSIGIDFPGLVEKWTKRGMPLQAATSLGLEGYRNNLSLFGALASVIKASAAFGKQAIAIAASGNESKRDAAPPYEIAVSPPAASEGFLSVGAIMRTEAGSFTIAPFSNTNVSVAAPGFGITSAKTGGGLAPLNGTSMATPHVAGVAALWAERLKAQTGEMDPSTLVGWLVGNSDLGQLSSNDAGAGLVVAPQA